MGHSDTHTHTHGTPLLLPKSTLHAGPAVLECDSCEFRFLATGIRLQLLSATTCFPSTRKWKGREMERSCVRYKVRRLQGEN